jgi:gamma-glutamyltranspeptidase
VPQPGYAYRPAALGRHAMVASAHPLATLAGVQVLEAGGTAADAAVAVNAVLAVTQPNWCGVGGDLFCLYHEARSGRVHFLNGAGRSGERATVDELRRRGHQTWPLIGGVTVSVPGCVRAWAMLLERFGTRPLEALLRPAVRHAAEGFPISDLVSQAIAEFAPANPDPEWHRVFMPGGRVPRHGELFVQADLARTLDRLAREGPVLFETGAVARPIAARLAVDGFLTGDDLAAHTGEWGEPISSTYRGRRVYQTPPPTQGLAALLALNLLEGAPLARHALHSVPHLHRLLEMVKLAYADRDRWIGDPEHARVPVDGLLDPGYAARRRRLFDPGKAGTYTAGNPEGDTTGFVVADGAGNVASVIQSLFTGWGSGIVPPGTGVVLNNRGRLFTLDPEHPSGLAPRKRPFHTLMAAIVTRDDRPEIAFASMGGQGQAMFHVQVLTNLIDFGLDVQEAIERPRFVIGAFGPDEAPTTVHLERRVPRAVFTGLARKGHPMKAAPALFTRVGHAHGLVIRDGTLMGGADPRGDGCALGF